MKVYVIVERVYQSGGHGEGSTEYDAIVASCGYFTDKVKAEDRAALDWNYSVVELNPASTQPSTSHLKF